MKRKMEWGWKPKEDAAEVLAVISMEVRQCDWRGAHHSPLFHQVRIEQREIANKESNDLGEGMESQ